MRREREPTGWEERRHVTARNNMERKRKQQQGRKKGTEVKKRGTKQQKQRFREEQMDGQGMTALKISNCLPI